MLSITAWLLVWCCLNNSKIHFIPCIIRIIIHSVADFSLTPPFSQTFLITRRSSLRTLCHVGVKSQGSKKKIGRSLPTLVSSAEYGGVMPTAHLSSAQFWQIRSARTCALSSLDLLLKMWNSVIYTYRIRLQKQRREPNRKGRYYRLQCGTSGFRQQ